MAFVYNFLLLGTIYSIVNNPDLFQSQSVQTDEVLLHTNFMCRHCPPLPSWLLKNNQDIFKLWITKY